MTRSRRDGGFTLIELMMAMTIGAIVLSSLVAAMLTFLKNGNAITQRDDRSIGAALLASYLDRDFASTNCSVSSACTVRTPDSADWASVSSSCSGVTNAAVLYWQEYTATPSSPTPSVAESVMVAYAVIRDSTDSTAYKSARYEIKRWYCYQPGAPSANPPYTGFIGSVVDQEVLVRNLTGAPEFSFSAGTPACATGAGYVLDLSRYSGDAASYSGYTFTGCTNARIH